MPKTNPMYNMGRQSEHRRDVKASMLTKSQVVAKAKKAFLVQTCCPHGAKKGAKKNILWQPRGKRSRGLQRQRWTDTLLRYLTPIFKTTDEALRAVLNRKNW